MSAKTTFSIKSCPFCGGIPSLINRGHHQSPPFEVICRNKLRGEPCNAQIWPCYSADEAVERWNTRSP